MNRENREGGNPHACASCKHQRKKCDESCELAPYFPASRYPEFQYAQKLFGVSNIQKIINSVEPHQRQAAAESILLEGTIRHLDPVHGCLGVVRNLNSQLEFYEKQLGDTNQQLLFFRENKKQQSLEKFLTSSSSASSALPPSMFENNQFDGFNFQAPNQPVHLPNISDLKIFCGKYNYQSTMEEGADVMQAIDQMMNPHQTEQALTCLDGPGDPNKASGKQPQEYVSDEEAAENVDSSSLKGKKRME